MTAIQAQAAKTYVATLVRAERITPADSPEEVKHLVFRSDSNNPLCQAGQCIRVLAPGQHGNKHHPRLYLVAEPETGGKDGGEFALCVKRHDYIDDFNGERYPGVASNYLCDLKAGANIEFAGPFGYPFEVPADRKADIASRAQEIAPGVYSARFALAHTGAWDLVIEGRDTGGEVYKSRSRVKL